LHLLPEKTATHLVEHQGIAMEMEPLKEAVNIAMAQIEKIQQKMVHPTFYYSNTASNNDEEVDVCFEGGTSEKETFLKIEERQYNNHISVLKAKSKWIDQIVAKDQVERKQYEQTLSQAKREVENKENTNEVKEEEEEQKAQEDDEDEKVETPQVQVSIFFCTVWRVSTGGRHINYIHTSEEEEEEERKKSVSSLSIFRLHFCCLTSYHKTHLSRSRAHQ
jgi:hypothetical protein